MTHQTTPLQSPQHSVELLAFHLFQRHQCEHPQVGFLEGKLLCMKCGMAFRVGDQHAA